jgi:hypothetical protein
MAEIDCGPGEAQDKLDAFRGATMETLDDHGMSLYRLTTATDLSTAKADGRFLVLEGDR